MNLFDAVERFSDQEACIKHLEEVRWGGNPECPRCESEKVAPKNEQHIIGRWNCHTCKSSFNVLQGTVFQGTQIPLQKWPGFIAGSQQQPETVESWEMWEAKRTQAETT